MIGNIEIYFTENPNTPHGRGDENKKIRKSKAHEQAKLLPVQLSQVFTYVNEFLEKLQELNGKKCKTTRLETFFLDKNKQIILDNGIIVNDCKWIEPEWDDKTKKYSIWEPKYSSIKNKFGLSHTKNILWLKFTTSGHLGVVAKGMDINFDYNINSGELVKEVGKLWDESFVMIFPLTDLILSNQETGDIERAVGNYLVEKNVPIIDFYSHNY